jgi:hypothetical protein
MVREGPSGELQRTHGGGISAASARVRTSAIVIIIVANHSSIQMQANYDSKKEAVV